MLVFIKDIPNCSDILTHLKDLKLVYDTVRHLSKYELHAHLLKLEDEYFTKLKSNEPDLLGSSVNFCEIVHKLTPHKYANEIHKTDDKSHLLYTFKHSTYELLKCHQCMTKLSDEQSYNLHMLNQIVICVNCKNEITIENIKVQYAIMSYNTNRFAFLNAKCLLSKKMIESNDIPESISKNIHTYNKIYPDLIKNSDTQIIHTWNNFYKYIMINRKKCKYFNSTDKRQMKKTLEKVINSRNCNIANTSFDFIKGMYRQLLFVIKICSNYDYWLNDSVLNISIDRYSNFMLMITSNSMIGVPTIDIDLVWHTHLTMVSKYHGYCRRINNRLPLSHRLIKHDDTIESYDLTQAHVKTYITWSKLYDSEYSYKTPTFDEYLNNSSMSNCFSIFVPYYKSRRYNKWIEYTSSTNKLPKKPDNKTNIIGTSVIDGFNYLKQHLNKTKSDKEIEFEIISEPEDLTFAITILNGVHDNHHIPLDNFHGCGNDGCGSHGCGNHGCGNHGCGSHGCGSHGCGSHGCGSHGCGSHGCGGHGCGGCGGCGG